MKISYMFQSEEVDTITCDVVFDEETLLLTDPVQEELPPWTALENCKCSNCPLSEMENPYCPIAVRLLPLAKIFGGVPSYKPMVAVVVTPERKIINDTTVQQAMSSLLGLIMPLSGCPHFDFLKPMARFHLPFSSMEETIFRATSTYLLGNHFLKCQGLAAQEGLTGLSELYGELQKVNQGLSKRLRSSGDFMETNAVAILDVYAQTIPFVIDDFVTDLGKVLSAYQDVKS
ncbi:hypothetical protein [Terasakiella sp. SH-1]|uniref:DUF6901 family protein n=1 Tax=Terasakiella sp. SH-1 TaxID=2560057 RepID=UPI0010747E6E|nr:hypothetical protein [Terasakiella sp. SH-1]